MPHRNMSMRNRRIALVVAILAIIVMITGILICFTKSEESNVELEWPTQVQTNQKYIKISTKSWANNAWLAGTNPEKIISISFINKYDHGIASKAWVFDGISFYLTDGTAYAVVGNGLKITGSMSGAFSNLLNLKYIDGLDLVDTSEVGDMSSLFENCISLMRLDIDELETSSVILANKMFKGCESLEFLNMSNVNMQNALDMSEMFAYCKAMNEINLPKTRDVVNLSRLFEQVGMHSSYKTAVNGELGTEFCEDMSYMFVDSYLYDYTIAENFNTKNLKSAEGMFYGCATSVLDLSDWDTSSLETTKKMFWSNMYMESCNVSGWNVQNLQNCESMFFLCTSLREIALGWKNVPNIQNAAYLFTECFSLATIDMSCFAGTHVGDAREMFAHCDNLVTIYGEEFKADASDRMFNACENLVGGVKYIDSQVNDIRMANQNGYFKSKE